MNVVSRWNEIFGTSYEKSYFDSCVTDVCKKLGVKKKIVEETIMKIPYVSKNMEKTEPVPSMKTLDKLSSFFKKDLEKYYAFRGDYIYKWGWLLWLEKELKTFCLIKDKEDNWIHGFKYNLEQNKFAIEFNVSELIRNCKYNYLVGILEILGKKVSHANAIIFDIKNKIVTRFEPHGAITNLYDFNKLDKIIGKNIIHEFKGWKYRAPPNYCPRLGPQSRESFAILKESKMTKKVFGKNIKEPKGFCAAWSLLFIHFRVKNPDFSEKEVSDYFDSLTDIQLSRMIREYAEFIVNTIDRDWMYKLIDVGKVVTLPEGDGVVLKKTPKKIVVWVSIHKEQEMGIYRAHISQATLLKDENRKKEVIDKMKLQLNNKSYETKKGEIVIVESHVENIKRNKILAEILGIKQEEDINVGEVVIVDPDLNNYFGEAIVLKKTYYSYKLWVTSILGNISEYKVQDVIINYIKKYNGDGKNIFSRFEDQIHKEIKSRIIVTKKDLDLAEKVYKKFIKKNK